MNEGPRVKYNDIIARWYVVRGDGYQAEYLHLNGTWHESCGVENLFTAKQDARLLLEKYS